MIDELSKQDIAFLKYIKDRIIDKHNLPISCVSIEFMNDSYFKLIFPMVLNVWIWYNRIGLTIMHEILKSEISIGVNLVFIPSKHDGSV